MKLWSNVRKHTRTLHRSIGYLLFGVTLIYGISGYLMNHIGGHGGDDPAFKTTKGQLKLATNFTGENLMGAWNEYSNLPNAKRTMDIDEYHIRLFLDGGIGVYQKTTGIIEYQYHKKKQLVYYINKLHYNKVNGWTLPADLFAFSLIFLAVSGLFMARGKNGLGGNGKWWLIVGILTPIIYILLM